MFRRGLIVMAMAVLFVVSGAQGAILLDKVVAIVNKEVITWSELYKTMEFEALDAVKSMKAEEKRTFLKDNEAPFLEVLIDLRLQLQEAVKADIGVSEAEARRAIDSIKQKYSMTDEVFNENLKKEGFTFDEYKRKIQEQMIVTRLVEQEVRGKILVTEREVTDYLSAHPEMAKQGEGYTISHIFVKGENRKSAEEKAAEIYAKLKAGEDFGELARQYSEDSTAKNGGELGFVKKSEMSKDFFEVVSRMKDGDTSEPFWSASGMHILKLHETRTFKNPQDLRESVHQMLVSERFKRDYKNWMKGLRERAYVEIKL